MSIFITILIALLPLLIKWIAPFLKAGAEPMTAEEKSFLPQVTTLLKLSLDLAEAQRPTLGKLQVKKLDKAKKLYADLQAKTGKLGLTIS